MNPSWSLRHNNTAMSMKNRDLLCQPFFAEGGEFERQASHGSLLTALFLRFASGPLQS